MHTQLQLDGPDLTSLLARVKSELGPKARIMRAEKVRTGGVAGFFARQHFEITVEVGDQQDAAAAGAHLAAADTDAVAPLSLLQLADSVSDNEQSLSLRDDGQGTRTAPDHDALSAPRTTAREAQALPTPTTGQVTFASVLANLDTWTGGSPTALPCFAPHAPWPVATEPGESRGDTQLPPAPEGSDEPAGTQVSTEGIGFAALMSQLGAAVAAGTDPAVGSDHPAPVPAPRSPPERAAAPGAWGTSTVATTAVSPVPRPPAALPVDLPLAHRPTVTTVAWQLTRLGLPAHLQPRDGDQAVYGSLVSCLGALPQAPALVNRPGAVVAVVGPAAQALEAARTLGRDLGLPVASAVVLATSPKGLTDLPERQVLRDPDQGEARRSTWRWRRGLTIVAIDAPMTAAGAVQARAYLSVLAPSATWGAVEATRKAYDVGAFARAVGGFDALALSAVDETSDPAAVLELGIPVGRLGEQPATPYTWASLLFSRMAA